MIYWPARVFSRASWRCSSFNFSLGSLTWLTYAYGMNCQDDVAPAEFWLIQCACQLFFGLGTSTHVCLWSITYCYIIKRHGSHTWYGCWTIKALVEAEVLWCLYCESLGHSSAIDHSQIFRCLNILRLAYNLFRKGKNALLTCIYTSSVAIKQAVIKWFGKKPCWEKIA